MTEMNADIKVEAILFLQICKGEINCELHTAIKVNDV